MQSALLSGMMSKCFALNIFSIPNVLLLQMSLYLAQLYLFFGIPLRDVPLAVTSFV